MDRAMGDVKKRRPHHFRLLLLIGSLLFLLLIALILISPSYRFWWRTFTQESIRILGQERDPLSAEEKRIREEIILKRMEEAVNHQDWRALAPEYPRPQKNEPLEGKERVKALRESRAFQDMDREMREFLRKKEDHLFHLEPPTPSLQTPTDVVHLRDRGAEEAIMRLTGGKESASLEKPLQENLQLGIKGAVATRRILERPSLPQVKVNVEADIELDFKVLPDGTVDRITPSVRGDTELERIAIQYLKQWRFAPLPKDQPQVEQSGSIPIKFKLE